MSSSNSPLPPRLPPPDVPAFLAWLDEQGAKRHEGFQLRYVNDGSGWGVYSSQCIPRGSVLCAIPRDLILSAKTASLPLQSVHDDYAGLILHLTACLLHELRLGRESRWYYWLQVIPREVVDIPTLWSHERLGGEDGRNGLDWLVGTEVARELDKKDKEGLSLEDLRAYHASLALPPTNFDPAPPSLESFLYAYSLVSSRGFVIDAYHTIGLIPYCDMFNHSSRYPHTSLSVDAAVCESCGSLLPCPHDRSTSPERLAHLSEEYLNQLVTEGVADKVDMRAQRDIEAGEQVLSCYDEDKRNASLLVEYGFTDEVTNTAITWGYRDVLSPSTLPLFVGLVQSLEAEGIEGQDGRYQLVGEVIGDHPEPLQIRSSGAISPTLFVALYLQHTSHTELHQLREEVLETITQIRHIEQSPSFSGLRQTPTAASTIRSLMTLIRSRLACLRKASRSVLELQDHLDKLPASSMLERLGMRAMLSERRLLEKCLGLWQLLVKDAMPEAEELNDLRPSEQVA